MASNKLRKPPLLLNSPSKPVLGSSARGQSDHVAATSRTMMMAQASANVPYAWSLGSRKPTANVIWSSKRETSGPNSKSTSSAEQYWAARALTAEALLSARDTHHTEIRSLSLAEDLKRNREISTLAKEHRERHAGLERLVIVLVASLCSLVALVIYLATYYTQQRTARHPWSLPSHFTIPILSPFTSVVEHETSVIGSKIITVTLLLLTGVAYLTLRHRIPRAFG